jgi:imidazolonepropionase-like amidohydrolase
LHKAGVLVGLSYDGEYWRTRNLPFQAGTAAAYGLSKEEALQLVTANNAKILGIAQTVGTLEKGKHATLVVSKGDLLDMRTNQVEYAFIRGKRLMLDDKQKQLYRKYKEKYGL